MATSDIILHQVQSDGSFKEVVVTPTAYYFLRFDGSKVPSSQDLYTNAVTPIKLATGTTTAGTAPLYFISGNLLTVPVAGAVEFLTDKWYATITTGAARKELALVDAALTSGRITFATTNGRLMDAAGLLWDNSAKYVTITGGTAQSSITKGLVINSGLGSAGTDSFNAKGSTDQNLIITDTANNRVGIGIATPSTKVHILATTEQIRLGYDASNYASFTVSPAGLLTLTATTGTSGAGFQIASTTTQLLGFHGSTPVVQRSGAAQDPVATDASTLNSYGFTESQANGLVTLVNEIRAALVEKGMIKGSS